LALPRPGYENLGRDYDSELTVSRLRPLARRRFNTRRPFLVLIRTRKPWVRLRWRRFGWNVLLPFILFSGKRLGAGQRSPGPSLISWLKRTVNVSEPLEGVSTALAVC